MPQSPLEIAPGPPPKVESRVDMVFVPGGAFRMGSDSHYPEEAPAHRVRMDGFWMDRTPVTNRQFSEFVQATGYVTFAEIPPDPKDYPGALPHMLYAGSLVFRPPAGAVDLRDWSQWWTFLERADWRHPYGPTSTIDALDDHPVVHVAFADAVAAILREAAEDPEIALGAPYSTPVRRLDEVAAAKSPIIREVIA